ncbi:MAG: GNAT family N-acetyltransferase [Pseudomonadales bacterium]
MIESLTLRPDQDSDQPGVQAIVTEAFGDRPAEAQLVQSLKANGNDRLATVALAQGNIIGYVLASPIRLEPEQALRCLGIAPLAVAIAHQRQGVGTELMRFVIDRARAEGIDALFLLGDPAYYQRFGFQATHIGNEYGATAAFMALELATNCLSGVDAVAQYSPEFAAADV